MWSQETLIPFFSFNGEDDKEYVESVVPGQKFLLPMILMISLSVSEPNHAVILNRYIVFVSCTTATKPFPHVE